jgi:hypothetical protein
MSFLPQRAWDRLPSSTSLLRNAICNNSSYCLTLHQSYGTSFILFTHSHLISITTLWKKPFPFATRRQTLIESWLSNIVARKMLSHYSITIKFVVIRMTINVIIVFPGMKEHLSNSLFDWGKLSFLGSSPLWWISWEI